MKFDQLVCAAVIGVSMAYGGVAFAQDACADYEEHFDAPKTITQTLSADAKELDLRMDCLGEKLDLSDEKKAELRKILEPANRDQLTKRLSGAENSASATSGEAAIKDLDLSEEDQEKLQEAIENTGIAKALAADEASTGSGGDSSPKIIVIRGDDDDQAVAKVIDVDKEVAELLDDEQLEGYREIEALRQAKLEQQREQKAKNREKLQEFQENQRKEAGEETQRQ
jgi:hypothetical protein